jgi:Protein of unknown function (DUF4238)
MPTKRHHYVSKFYLEQFADLNADLSKPSIWVFERGGIEPKLIPADNAAVQTHYYSIKKQNGQNDDIFEQFLSTNEGHAAPVLGRIQKEGGAVNGDDRGKVAVFISLLLLRVPAARKWVDENVASLERVRARAMARAPGILEGAALELERESGETSSVSVDTVREFLLSDRYTIEVSPGVSLDAMYRFGETTAKILIDMRWDLLKSEDEPFLTSDNPVTYVDPTNRDGLMGTALLAKGVELTFPISPTMCLLATHNKGFYDCVVKESARGVRNAALNHIPETFYRSVLPAVVRQINRRTVWKATRYVFSSRNQAPIRRFIAKHFRKPKLFVSGE